MAAALRRAGLATLLFDLLTEEEAAERRNVFDIELLADRLALATTWVDGQDGYQEPADRLLRRQHRRRGGAGRRGVPRTRLSAPLSRAADVPTWPSRCSSQVRAPTLLIVGGHDVGVLELNEQAFAKLQCEKNLEIVPGATHLFEEPGALDQVIDLARQWFTRHLIGRSGEG